MGAVNSGKVMSVAGPIPVEDLGVTLMHEHILNDCSCWWNAPTSPDRAFLAEGPVRPEILWHLRQDPFVNRDNLGLRDEAAAIEELGLFAGVGGRSVVDPTCRGIGRNPAALARIARATGLQIVMGSGYYLESSHPAEVAGMSAEAIAAEIEAEAVDGLPTEDGPVRIGLVGEIGVSGDFTTAETRSLRGAARASARTGLPLMVHLPGWFRHGHKVLDIAGEEGADLSHTVLCHMNPSFRDADYQMSLAARGAFLEYDMMGMDFFYADQGVQCPVDYDTCGAIKALIDAGFGWSVLLSQDVFLKMMLTRHGGNGYAHVHTYVLPLLGRLGVAEADLARLTIDNPRAVFSASHRAGLAALWDRPRPI
ncbi:phosphotriesterase family protein [Acuticoccus kandeliae]|uniref:phosphotriesterase family protein n=1 Tax=Acuticoccus kandeliae TaxID=2073160 RepID=UPI00196AF411|nr:phosphotriesterase [Acuticoccus kandeliae]